VEFVDRVTTNQQASYLAGGWLNEASQLLITSDMTEVMHIWNMQLT
jgi:hypothetical protein